MLLSISEPSPHFVSFRPICTSIQDLKVPVLIFDTSSIHVYLQCTVHVNACWFSLTHIVPLNDSNHVYNIHLPVVYVDVILRALENYRLHMYNHVEREEEMSRQGCSNLHRLVTVIALT